MTDNIWTSGDEPGSERMQGKCYSILALRYKQLVLAIETYSHSPRLSDVV